jgi:LPS export ABC transporter protein LptC
MRKLKVAIAIAIVSIGLVVFVTVWANLRGKRVLEEGEVPAKVSTDGADTRLEKIHLVEDKHGQKTWELEAKSVQQYQDQNIMLIEEVKLTFFAKEGRYFVVSGNQGKIHQDSKDMELSGDVIVTSSDGYRLKTQSVSYRHSEKKITTSDPVEIEGDLIRLEGRGMFVDMEAKIFKVLSQVKTRWKGGRKG